MVRKLILAGAVVASLACDRGRAEEMKTLARMQEISAQKDSLLKDVMATTAFLADLGKQVSTVRNVRAGRTADGKVSDLEDNLTPAERRAMLLDRVREVTERVNLAENRLAASRKRVSDLAGTDAEKTKQLAAFDSTIVSFREIMDNQRAQIASFTEQVNALTAENTQLKSDNAVLVSNTATLTVTKDSLTTEQNTVYYVVDTRKALIDKNVIRKEGGFLGLGKQSVAARDLNPAEFVSIDMTKVDEIPLPKADKTYRIVSRQDLSALETPLDKEGHVKGSLKIRDAQAFWKASKFLIVIEQ